VKKNLAVFSLICSSVLLNVFIASPAWADYEYDMRRNYRWCIINGGNRQSCARYDIDRNRGDYQERSSSEQRPRNRKRSGFFSDFGRDFARHFEYETRNTRYKHNHGKNNRECITINGELWCKY
jgi:hypothetical protein